MWSDQYAYFQLYADKTLLTYHSTSALRAFLDGLPELQKETAFYYKNSPKFPFFQLHLLHIKHLESWSDQQTDAEQTNFIPIVSSKREEDLEKIRPLMGKIADYLGWSLEEEN